MSIGIFRAWFIHELRSCLWCAMGQCGPQKCTKSRALRTQFVKIERPLSRVTETLVLAIFFPGRSGRVRSLQHREQDEGTTRLFCGFATGCSTACNLVRDPFRFGLHRTGQRVHRNRTLPRWSCHAGELGIVCVRKLLLRYRSYLSARRSTCTSVQEHVS